MKKNTVTRAIVAMLLASLLLTSCQGKNSGTDSKAPGNALDKYEDDMSVKHTINAVVCQHPAVKDMNDNAFTKWIEEKLNIDLVINPIPSANWKDKLDVMMSTGEYPEVCIGNGFNKITMYGADEGIIRPLDDLITKYAPNILTADKEVPGLLNSMREMDGKIYAVGNYSEAYHTFYGNKAWYYAPFLEKLNLKAPTTTDEFYEVLKAIKKNDPNGNGIADEIPLMGHKNDYGFTFIGNAFLYLSGSSLNLSGSSLYLYNDKEAVKTAITKDEYREALKYMNRLYSEGLLYNNSFAQTMEQGQAIANAPQKPVVGFVTTLTASEFWPISAGGLYEKTLALTPLKGPKGVQYTSTSISPYATTTQGSFFITTKLEEKKLPRAIKIIDLLFTEEAFLRTWGVEGQDWVYSKEGALGLNGKQARFNSLSGWAPKVWGEKNASWINFFPGFQTAKRRMSVETPADLNIYSQQGLEKRLVKVTEEQYEKYGAIKMTLPKIKFTLDETNKISQKEVDVSKYADDSRIQFIIGSLNINDDAVWKKYLKDLESMGLNDILSQYQTGYNRQFNK